MHTCLYSGTSSGKPGHASRSMAQKITQGPTTSCIKFPAGPDPCMEMLQATEAWNNFRGFGFVSFAVVKSILPSLGKFLLQPPSKSLYIMT